MQSALHVQTTISPDHKIEIQDPNLPTGEIVDVFIVSQKQVSPKKSTVIKMIEEIRSHRTSFTDIEKINKSLAEERDSWDS